MNMNRYTKNEENRRGAAIVEMAIVLPLLIIVLFGVMEYSWLFYRVSLVNNVARDGVRVAVLPDASLTAVEASVLTWMTNLQMGSSDYTFAVSTDPAGDFVTVDPGTPVTVTITVPYGNIDLIGMAIFPTPTTLSASVTMAKEGP